MTSEPEQKPGAGSYHPRSGATLGGRVVGILETRRSDEMAALVERRGGQARVFPALREVDAVEPAAISALLGELERAPIDVAIFQTGVGADALLRHVRELGPAADARLRTALAGARVIARGPKPTAVLRTAGIRIDIGVGTPYTTAELLPLLEALPLARQRVLVQHHGGSNEALMAFLRAHQAEPLEVVLYRWTLPEDTGPLVALLDALHRRELDALLFTSASQVQNLFAVADSLGRVDELQQALDARTVVGAIGPVCAAALIETGLRPLSLVQPENPKMVPLLDAVAAHFAATAAPTSH